MDEKTGTGPAAGGEATQQQTSQAATTPPTGEGAAEKAPAYVTREELEKREKELISRLRQADRDRSKRVEGEIAGIKGLLSKAGVQVQPEQEAKLREEVEQRLEPTQPAEGSAAPDPDAQVAEFVAEIFAEQGTAVDQTDPEWADLKKVIDASWNDPKGHIKVTSAAIRASEKKATRIAAQAEAADARVVGAGGQPASNIGPSTTGYDLLSEAHK